MKIKILFFVLMITNLSDFMCMENVPEQYSPQKADEQLLNIIINHMPLKEEPEYFSYGVNKAGTQRFGLMYSDGISRQKFYFDAQQIEKVVVEQEKAKKYLLPEEIKNSKNAKNLAENTKTITPRLKLVNADVRECIIKHLTCNPTKDSIEIAQWLAQAKDGLVYFDENFPEKYSDDAKLQAMRCLGLIKETGNNNITLPALVQKYAKSGEPHYLEAVNLLLGWGADPNKLFYREKGKKKCYIDGREDTIKILIQVLLHPQRIIDLDEPEDFEYLEISSIMSIFNNHWKETGQKNLYNYTIDIYKLAFEIRKKYESTGEIDTQKLRKHIINYHKKTWSGFFYYQSRAIWGKIYSLKNIFTKKTTFWGYHIRPKQQ